MEVTVRHAGTGHSCVVGVPEGGTVMGLKADALDEMFAGSINADREAAAVAAHIEGCEEELDDAHHVADTGLEDGGAVQLVPRWADVKSPAVYPSRHDELIPSITLSRCGGLCSVGYTGGYITVFDTATAAGVADLTHGDRDILTTVFSPCGTWLATCSEDASIRVWLTATWEQAYLLERHSNARVRGAVWTPCGRLVSADTGGVVFVWELGAPPSATLLERRSKAVCGVAASSTLIYTGSDDSNIHIYDIATLSHTATLDGHTKGVTNLALTRDEQRLVSCSSDRTLKMWCTASLACLWTVGLNTHPSFVVVSQPGGVVAVGCSASVALHCLGSGACLRKLNRQGRGVALSPCGRWVFVPTGLVSVSVRSIASLLPQGCST